MLGVRIPPGLSVLIFQMNPVEKIKSWAQSAKQFYIDVRSEMKKVSWPARQEVVGTTVVVIVAVFFFGLYLGLVDYLLTLGLNWVLTYFRGDGGA
jgi:preprotein translocase subunit SecE